MRNPALIPLSREHHYALVLCRTLRRGALRDPRWVARWIEKTSAFFSADLKVHFEAEEQVLFPACRPLLADAPTLVESLLAEHRKLEEAVAALRSGEDLLGFATLLEAHIRKEERSLFEVLDARLDAATGETLQRGIEARIGTASCPRDPTLIQEERE